MEERNWYKKRITDDGLETAVNTAPSKLAYHATGGIQEHLSQLEERLDAFEPTMIDVQDLDCAVERSDPCLSVLSEPDSTLGDSLISVAPLPLPDSVPVPSTNLSISFESVTDGVHLAESERSLGAGDIQMGSLYVSDLLHERNLLTTRLETMRTRLAELKNQWRESLASLENQVVHLNQKISRDAECYLKQHEEDQTLIKYLKDKISGLQCEVDQAHEAAKKDKLRLSEQSAEIAMKEAKWLDKQVLLDSTIAGLKEHAQQIAVERDEATQNLMKLECQLNCLQDALKSANNFLSKREKDFELSQCQIEDMTGQLNPTTLEQADCKDETISTSGHEAHHQHESLSVTDDLKHSTTAQFVDERLQQKDRLIRIQRKRLKELQRMCTELIQNPQTTVSGGSKLIKNSRLPDRVDWFSELLDPSRLNRIPQSKINEHRMADELGTVIEANSHGVSQFSSDSIVNPTTPGQLDNNFNNHNLIDHAKSDYFRPVEMKSQCEIIPVQSVMKVTTAEDLQRTNFPFDSISWNYLRHVVIKFILSREREAVHLIRVLSTLLRLTADEEYLLRRALHSRSTWWPKSRGFCHVLPSSLTHGQFAKIIPPS
ncbi:hypothetical protein FBUS_00171 [Fasciolopsis buskii]|uniref:GRIP domain-containing protein n=1 Tax=Fasciolopsis buskii TaxID=27845 RepID=A0A8E0RRM5_9TREM|nr:hypothetical protein FBUS_00171 [Fasciolopsis buski]